MLVISSQVLFANHGSAQDINTQKIELELKHESLQTALTKLQVKSGFNVFYITSKVLPFNNISLPAKTRTISETLSLLLEGTHLYFKQKGNNIVITGDNNSVMENSSPMPPGPVKGIVTNEKGELLEGINITVKGANILSISTARGEFFFKSIPENAVLVFTSVNTIPLEYKVTGTNNITIQLKTKIFDLGEVVVNNGYQAINAERSAGSFAKPDMNVVYDRTTSMNIIQRLDGQVPGLVINNAPGASVNPLAVRGLTTIGLSRTPLIVLDGVPLAEGASNSLGIQTYSQLGNINPQDVEDITVLKDATAASIWGSRAANGVIVITSKKGKTGGKLKVDYDGFASFQGKPNLDYVPYLNSAQYMQAAKEIFFDPASAYNPTTYPVNNVYANVTKYTSNSSTGLAPDQRLLYNYYNQSISTAQFNTSFDSLSAINNRQQIKDIWYRNALLTNQTVSISGGSGIYTFYGSLAYTGTKSNRPGDVNNSYKIHIRQDFKPSNSISLFLVNDVTNTVTSSNNNISVSNLFYPFQLFKDANGNSISMPWIKYTNDSMRLIFQAKSGIDLNYNPIDDYSAAYTKSNSLINSVTGGGTVKLFRGLRFEGKYSYTRGSSVYSTYSNNSSYAVRSLVAQFAVPSAVAGAAPTYTIPNSGGNYQVANGIQSSWTVRNQLYYDAAFGKNKQHQITAIAGSEVQEISNNNNQTTARGYDDQLLTSAVLDYKTLASTGVANPAMPTNGTNLSTVFITPFSTTQNLTRFISYFSNAGYTYLEKYTLNASVRYDRSNLFGTELGEFYKPVYSVGGKWNIGKENFLGKEGWLNHLDVRVTYGVTGTAPGVGSASIYDILGTQINAVAPGPALGITTMANKTLSYESTNTLNFGLDFSVLKNRLSGSFDVYEKKTSNLIGLVLTDPLAGATSLQGNVGNLKNTGVEIGLTSLNYQSNSFSWSSHLALAYNKNTITNLNFSKGAPTTGGGQIGQQYLVGYSAFPIFAYKYAGLDNMGDPQVTLANKTITKAPNATAPTDVNYMGSAQPLWVGGLSNTFNYKGLSVSFNAVFNFDGVMRRNFNTYYTGLLTHQQGVFNGGLNAEFANRWKSPGDEAVTNIPSYVASASVNSTRRDVTYYQYADINVVSSAYVKFRDITVSYSLPPRIVKLLGVSNFRLRAQVSNIMLWRGNKNGIDPEYQDPATGNQTIPNSQGAISIGAHIGF
jgi:TonB-linked SusC/RagA family outer membrane protein